MISLPPHPRMRMINPQTKAVHIHKLIGCCDQRWIKTSSGLGIQCDSEHGLFPISAWLILQIRDNVVKEETVLSLLSTQHVHQPSPPQGLLVQCHVLA